MTNFDVYAMLARGVAHFERQRDAKKHDKAALAIAKQWRLFQQRAPSLGVADFARVVDETVPKNFDEYWDHPTFQGTLYYLLRAGAQPVLRAPRQAQGQTKRPKRRTSQPKQRKRPT